MSENEEHTGIALEPGPGPGSVPDKSLTMRAERLAGSPSCLNCGTGLKGPFCYYCGQPDRNFFRFFPALLREFMSDFLELDSRFARTMKPLLFKPGRLTRDYLEGRRFRYTPPMRLYLFSSIAFFLLAAMLSSNAISTSTGPNSEGAGFITINPDREEQLEQAEEALRQLPDDVREQINLDLGSLELAGTPDSEQDPDGQDNQEQTWFDSADIQFNDQPWDRESNPVDIKWLPSRVNEWINNEVEQSPDKADRINKNPNLIVEQIFDILPATMFVLLPVVALLFKFWYLFAKRYYVEHLIFALHNHAFMFVSLMLLLLLSIAQGLLKDAGAMVAAQAAAWLVIALSIWIPLYLLISLRHVYRQNWFLTLCKFGVIGVSYITLLGLVTSVVAVLGFVLL
jgi:hypothetical protein